ncbi:helix-turn-helix domain-containing protein [Actinoplanes sp. TBRC 11911]|uniref:helix-turn-helix domain-containing protein n=1 Tax=Actinoplanes sp. TBRC 11911 TaxID=2729386 RepID=UPI00145D5A03|nr:helix-turn-helix transcriptional regulator [Actinoplanes sp. TBRC 11911]NMO51263.1 helix-turn-helix domain-containing protein [Actinoplanes sp. TBRC 11911]
MASDGRDPEVQRRRLRVKLRVARDGAGLSQKDVATEMDWSQSKLLRIEAGTVTISTNDLKALLRLYEITDQAQIDEFVAMARAVKAPAWWSPYRNQLSKEFATMLSYESAASIIRNFQPLLMPGLLQTDEYARATLAEMTAPPVDSDAILVDKLVEVRMARQDLLGSRPDPPKLFFAIDEAVLYRMVGGPGVMRRQLERLRSELVEPATTIWVVPFAGGLYQYMRGSYMLLELPSPEVGDDILYIEDARGEWIIRDDLEETAGYLEAFFQMEQIAHRNEDAVALVDRAIAALDRPGRDDTPESSH